MSSPCEIVGCNNIFVDKRVRVVRACARAYTENQTDVNCSRAAAQPVSVPKSIPTAAATIENDDTRSPSLFRTVAQPLDSYNTLYHVCIWSVIERRRGGFTLESRARPRDTLKLLTICDRSFQKRVCIINRYSRSLLGYSSRRYVCVRIIYIIYCMVYVCTGFQVRRISRNSSPPTLGPS